MAMTTASQDALAHFRTLSDPELVDAYAACLIILRRSHGRDRDTEYANALLIGQVARERGRPDLLEEGAEKARERK